MARIRICDQHFEGPFDPAVPGIPPGRSGVFVIISDCNDGVKRMADVAHARDLQQALTDPQNHSQWRRPYGDRFTAYVWQPGDADSGAACASLVEAVIARYKPICARGRKN